ncbi:MAG: polyamine aminopropyltransferase [Rhodanobacteraceae bacterium]|nr:polyamine aminopropyltransferase [Rhodanobacteraceae bacterium]MBK7043703.1 polyamine aminopropyltransferase [Rhodanobacteraceae bacterium]MBP9154829.1 polyamine aminopropyltransferase [Xanthomonadales bacterium]HQW80789.1 polyamine aminopropyltransferase [Pseudomonadota bacterium]
MSLDSTWFSEPHELAGSAISFRIKRKLAEEQTPFQKIEVYETTDWGNLMVIDGCVMLTTRDNFLYHEMIAHPVLFTHTSPKRVVIIGGGDCGTLREVLKHREVESVVQCDIDERVTRLAEQYFPELCDSNSDPRAKLMFDDGIAYMKSLDAESIDVVIVDSTDPIGPAEGLFNEAFYQSCLRALRPGGILVQQSESPLVHMELTKAMRNAMKNAGFAHLRTLPFPQPCYPTGWWSATMARKHLDLNTFRERGAATKQFPTKYYNADTHKAALAMPNFLGDFLGE